MRRAVLLLATLAMLGLALVCLSGCAGFEHRVSASVSDGKRTASVDYTFRPLPPLAGLRK